MKNAVILMCVVLILENSWSQSEESTDFYQKINKLWSGREYSALLAKIDGRLELDSQDIWALYLKTAFYLYAQQDLVEAHAVGNSFISAVDASSASDDNKRFAKSLVESIIAIPVSEQKELSTEQRDALHAEFEEFPLIDKGYVAYVKISGKK